MRGVVARALGALGVLFMLFDGTIHILRIPAVAAAFARLGFPLSLAPTLGIIEIVGVIVYLIPRTSLLGAVLLTGYLGGATATQVRIGADPFSTIFPSLIAALLWGSLLLRHQGLRSMGRGTSVDLAATGGAPQQ